MGRIIRDWKPENVEDFEVAPHRYLWTGGKGTESDPYADTYKEWLDSVPYKPGEVVYVDEWDGVKKARILYIFSDHDRYGDRRERYRIQFATKKGEWSKLYTYTYPGPIQRGYQKMGLAPEMPDNE